MEKTHLPLNSLGSQVPGTPVLPFLWVRTIPMATPKLQGQLGNVVLVRATTREEGTKMVDNRLGLPRYHPILEVRKLGCGGVQPLLQSHTAGSEPIPGGEASLQGWQAVHAGHRALLMCTFPASSFDHAAPACHFLPWLLAPLHSPHHLIALGTAPPLQVPVLKPMDLMVEVSPRRVFANGHTYHINSISVNSDCETYMSADDLRINLWHLAITDRSFSILSSCGQGASGWGRLAQL